MRLERRHQPLAPWRVFLRRLGTYLLVSFAVVAATLFGGMAGYHLTEGLPWLDSFLNAAMILGGMGPVDPITTQSGKVFAGLYALFCGLVFIGVSGLLIAPVLHRLLHRFHLDEQG